uniref:Exocyst subunit Exo70 family protein n=1 Tax=Wollemia nobilis TaxID=56998 RepID=A0A0C9RZ14_9CONI
MEIEEVEAGDGGGEERVLATAHHIVKSLGTSENMTRDMLRILAKFDNRLSAMSPGAESSENRGNLEENFAEADRLISKWDTNIGSTMLFQSSQDEARQYLAAVDNLHHLMTNLSVTDSSSAKMIRGQRLMEASMARLKKEFHRILLSNSNAIDREGVSTRPSFRFSTDDSRSSSSSDDGTDDGGGGSAQSNRPSTDRICEIEMIPLDAVMDLRAIAHSMASAGYGRECVGVFTLTRKSVVEESFYNLGVERVTLSEVQKMEWEALDAKIKHWISAVKICIRVLFASEKRLCDQVFDELGLMRDSCFVEVAKDATARLLGFVEAVAASRRSPEKLFRVVDLYVTLADLLPDIETLYSQEACRIVRERAAGLVDRLGEAVRGILTEFENAIQRENSKTPTPGGTIHPLTRYVMNYLTFLSDYKETLVKITAGTPIQLPKAVPEGLAVLLDGDDLDGPSAALCIRVRWIVIVLQCKLDGKSKLYKDVALSYLFLMNNLHYIVQKGRGSELKHLVGDEFLRRNSGKVGQYTVNYEKAAWIKVLSCLREEGIHVGGSYSGGVSQQALKDRFKGFNFAFEEVMKSHAAWVVPDLQLRDDLLICIAEKLIPAYRSFLGRFRNRPESGRHSDTFIKYTAEELENFLLDLFKGSSPSSVGARRSR